MRKTLIVDDDKHARATVAPVLEKNGASVIHASDGMRGYHILEDNPDIVMILTDLAMPHMDGKEFIKIIRGKHDFKAIPILIMSGIADEQEVKAILKLGGSWFLPKPVQLTVIQEVIDMLGWSKM